MKLKKDYYTHEENLFTKFVSKRKVIYGHRGHNVDDQEREEMEDARNAKRRR